MTGQAWAKIALRLIEICGEGPAMDGHLHAATKRRKQDWRKVAGMLGGLVQIPAYHW